MEIKINNPIIAARELHMSIGWSSPDDFTLHEIANYLGLLIKEIPISGSEGRILSKGKSGIISINSSINYAPKKNFIIAHEIGHFILHKNVSALFNDTDKTLAEWYATGPQEKQANEFASELLMPEIDFKSNVDGVKLNLELIDDLSKYYHVSLTAAFLRYVKHGSYPLMVVFIEDGLVKWKQHSNDFPHKYLLVNSKVPPLTVAGDFFLNRRVETEPERVDAIEWFPDDYNLQRNPDYKLWEQCYKVSEKGFISCIWTD